MIDLGTHAGFILAAYGATIVIVLALALWIVIYGRAQRRRLTELEARGVRRRSAAKSSVKT